jgi:hypothetical protein
MSHDLKDHVERLSRSLAVLAVRNTFLETLHSGKVPQSEAGDYSDVKVVSPTEEIPWTEVSRLSDPEMKNFIKEVVNRLYTILLPLLGGKNQEELEQLLKRGEEFARAWDKAEIEPGLRLPDFE